MKLTVHIQEKEYELQYSDAFVNKLSEHALTLRAVQEELRLAGDQLADTKVGETFFLVGSTCSLEGTKETDKLILTRFIPLENVI